MFTLTTFITWLGLNPTVREVFHDVWSTLDVIITIYIIVMLCRLSRKIKDNDKGE